MGILTDDMKRVVAQQRLGFVATVCPDGTPNLSPKGTTAVHDDDHLVFIDIRSPRTVANLRANPAVEINVVDQIVRKGYRFKGRATEVVDPGPRFDELLRGYENIRGGENRGTMLLEAGKRARTVVLVEVERAVPLISPGYDWVENEEEMRAHWRQHFEDLESSQA
jgi:predicted pyridoxine 5'-phosphate oxidase superfamily flavin-nucleotide-binding protein